MRKQLAAGLCIALVILSSGVALGNPPVPGQPGGYRGDRPPEVETNVIATAAGVTIYVGVRYSSPGAPPTPGSTVVSTARATPTCTASVVNPSFTTVHTAWFREGLRDNPNSMAYTVACQNPRSLSIVWVPNSVDGPPDVVVELLPDGPLDPLAMADAIFGIVPLPPIAIGASPGTGLVAMPSWWWVDGYGGEALSGSETLGGTTVEAEIWPRGYEWSFGDGGALSTSSLGRRYPDESDIQHTYERSSGHAAFEVTLTIVFDARYREITEEEDADGNTVVVTGEWQSLSSIPQSFALPYPVQQSQSIHTAGR